MGPPHGVGSVWLMMVVGLAGILIGDSIIFKAGHDYGDKLLDTRLGRHIPPQDVERVRELFQRHGSKMILVARFLPGLRAVTYFVAGTSGVRYLVFVLYDGVAALVSAPAWVWLGYWMGKRHAIRRAYAMAKEFQLWLLALVALALLGSLLWWLLAQRRRAAQAMAQRLDPPRAAPGPGRNGHNGLQRAAAASPAPTRPGAGRA